MNKRISKKVLALSPSMTLAVTAKAQALRSQGVDIISLSAGEPDFDTPQPIAQAAIDAILAGETKYTLVQGTVSLREAITKKIKLDTGLDYTTDQIIVSNGAKHTIMNALFAILDKGDEVLIPSPYWVSYTEMVKLAGGVPVIVPTSEDTGFIADADLLSKYTTDRTKALMLNSPSNPTGAVYPKEVLQGIAEWAVSHQVFVLSDEIYGKLIYEGEHKSIASLDCDAYNLTILINGVSKAYAMTGWRIGYAAGPADIIKAMNGIQSQMTSNPNSIAQIAATKALLSDDSLISPMVDAFKARRDYCYDRLRAIPHLRPHKPQGAFYLFVNTKDLYSIEWNGEPIGNSIRLCEFLLDQAHVAAVPGIGFGEDDYIRISFATSMELLEKAMDRIEEAVRGLL